MPSGQGPARAGGRFGGARARPTGRYAVGEPGTAAGSGQQATGLRGGQPARRTRAPRGPVRVSGRAATLGVVLLVLLLSYAYPLRMYLAQQAEISRLESSQRAQRQHIQDLSDEVARWQDPEYVKDQALQRFMLVEVGQQVYVVGSDPAETSGGAKANVPSWYQQVWTSVQTADDPPSS
jgi:cell division protein FtsB